MWVSLVQIYHEKKKDSERRRNNNDEEDEDTTVQQNSDEEEETNAAGQNPLIEILNNNVRKISDYLTSGNSAPKCELETSYDVKLIPLGHLRLRIVELVYHLLKLGKSAITQAVIDSDLLPKISQLVENYPWNNFLQLKVIALFEEVFENLEPEQRRQALQKSNVINTLVNLGGNTRFEHSSTRKIRHGYMAIVVKIGNLLVKNKEKAGVAEFLASLEDPLVWKQFVEGELLKSNETNNKNLGGQQPRNPIDDDNDDKDYEMNMEKIMAKFSNFNSNMSNKENSSQSEEDDEDEDTEVNRNNEEEEEVKQESPQKQDHSEEEEDQQAEPVLKEISVSIEEQTPLVKEYIDQQYWHVDIYSEKSVDDLLADYEWTYISWSKLINVIS